MVEAHALVGALIAVLSIASWAAAAWAYTRAFRIHNQIERRHPGFNERMRKTYAVLRNMGLKR